MSGKSMPVDLDHLKPFMGFCTAITCLGVAILIKSPCPHFLEAFVGPPKKKHQIGGVIYTLGIQTPCQRTIGVSNHLRNAKYLGSMTILRR